LHQEKLPIYIDLREQNRGNVRDLRQKVKDAGGKWSKSTKTWKIPYKTARKSGLKK
jgi:hypothetical protein